MSCGGFDAGKLRHQIDLQSETESLSDRNETILTYATYATVRASVRPIQGGEMESAQQISAEVTHKIRIRYNSAIKPIDRILFGTRQFDIKNILNFQERNILQDILCVEVVGG